ncbi:MAG TPA: hypothetical protein VKD90_05040 [Gemmataceae bacterium]|nr:hypothetical protein [Gemmataceae bacterium]
MGRSGLASGLVLWALGYGLRAAEPGPPARELELGPVPREVAPASPQLHSSGDRADARLRSAVRQVARRWSVWAEVYYRIAVAPKLVYRLDKVVVYRDGVWAEFSVTNPGLERTYLAAHWVVPPVWFEDSSGRAWATPKFDGCVLFAPVNKFVAVPAGEAVRFRSRLSFAEGPLEPAGRAARPAPAARPTELAYTAAGWRKAYTAETVVAGRDVYAVGSGKVAVKWFDAAAPKSWGPTTRLYGDEG